MIRWLSFEGFEGRASRILALSWLTVVVADMPGKVNGLVTPVDGDTTIRVKPSDSGLSSSPVEASIRAGVPRGEDMLVVEAEVGKMTR